MFTRVEIQNFRSLRDVSVNLSNFHVLVGANGSGKTTFLDVFSFVGDMLREGLNEAMQLRKIRWEDLKFSGSENHSIDFKFEALLPKNLLEGSPLSTFDMVRYELSIYQPLHSPRVRVGMERCYLFRSTETSIHWDSITNISSDGNPYFLLIGGIEIEVNESDIIAEKKVFQIFNSNGEFSSGVTEDKLIRWDFNFDKESIGLGMIPEDIKRSSVTTWLKNQFKKFLQPIEIESDAINKAGREGRSGIVSRDGSNLPWLIDSLKAKYPDRYDLWMEHVRAILPQIQDIRIVAREDQDDKFLLIKFKEGNEVKSWLVSDGTLRILLLTIIPYNIDLQGLFLIESPETEINPQAIQSVMDSLRSVYEGQVLVTTHSPEAVNCVRKSELLIFTKNENGATEIVSGSEHPYLKNSKEDLGSAVFYGAGTMR